MKSWISAKNVFHTAISGATKFPMCVMRSPTTKGWPWALARMLASTKPRPNMNGWNCRARVEDPEEAQDDLQDALGRDGQGEPAGGAPSRPSCSWCRLPSSCPRPWPSTQGTGPGPGWSARPRRRCAGPIRPRWAGLVRQRHVGENGRGAAALTATGVSRQLGAHSAPNVRRIGRPACLTACTSTPEARPVGPAHEPDRRADSLVGPAAELARHWLESAAPTRVERAQAARLHALTSDPGSVSFAMAFCDRVLRPESPRVAARQLRRLARGTRPAFLSAADGVLLRSGARLSSPLPGTVVRLARQRLRAVVGDLVTDAEDPALGRHLDRLRAEGFGVNVNLLGEAVLGHHEAARRRDALVALMERADVDYVSVKVSSVAAQLNLWSYRETLARTKDALRVTLRAGAAASPPAFVNSTWRSTATSRSPSTPSPSCSTSRSSSTLEAGVVLQAYVPDSLDALVRLAGWAASAARPRRRRGEGTHRQGGQSGRGTGRRRHARVATRPLRHQGRHRRQPQGHARVRPAARATSAPCTSAWPATTSSIWPGPISWPTPVA